MESDPRIEEIDGDGEDPFGLRDDRLLYARNLASIHTDGGNGWQRYMMEQDGHADASGPADGTDFDMYEETDSTVAYAIQLAMKDKEEWLVDKALERIRRAQFDGQKNVRLSKRELEALERKRLQANNIRDTERKNVSPRHSKVMVGNPVSNGAPGTAGLRRTGPGVSLSPTAPAPPYPLADTNSIYGNGAWARTTGASLGSQSPKSPQSPTKTLRSPLQPPFNTEPHHPGSFNRPPSFFAAPGYTRPYPDDYQWVPPYQVSLPREQLSRGIHSPTDPLRGSPTRPTPAPYTSNFPSALDERHPSNPQAPFASGQEPLASTPEQPVTSKSDESKNGSPTGSGDELQMVEVIEHKVPSTPTRASASRGSRQRSSRS